MKTRSFIREALIHCFQNTRNGFLLFYSISDYLVYFTICCVFAVKHGVRIVSVSLMPDHVHHGIVSPDGLDLSGFFMDTTAAFSRSDSVVCDRKGGLFNRPFGSAPKIGDKKIRTNIIYIGNNPVERKLCVKAPEYRWNFLAYAESDHPFSEKLVIRRASWAMKKAVKEVRAQHARGRYLSYKLLQRLFSTLNIKEKFQLVDFIITTYSVIDYEYCTRYFGGYSKMVKAMEYNTGSEYDIKETFTGKSDECYAMITRWLTEHLHLDDIHKVFSLSEQEREGLLWMIHYELGIDIRHLMKYLRINIDIQ